MRSTRTGTVSSRRALPPPADTGPPLAEAWTLPANWYVDAAHHEIEMQRVFGRSWQVVAHTARLSRPGSHVAAEAAGEPIVVVRGEDGAIRAFFNVCRHRAGAVVAGDGCAAALRCTYHGWTYSLEGSLRAAPEMDGVRHFDRKLFGLVPVRCEVWEPFVFVNLDPAAAPLAQFLGTAPRRLRNYRIEAMPFGQRDVYTLACNWKVYVDNFLEGYHIPRAHPGLHRAIDYKGYTVEPDGWTVMQHGPSRKTAGRGRRRAGGPDAGRPIAGGPASEQPPERGAAPRIRKGLQGPERTGSHYLWVYPNFMINLSPDYVQTNLIVPLGPERTATVFDYYFDDSHGPTAEAARRRAVAWSDEIQQEDVRICEAVQKNLRSRSYEAGRYSARRENGLHHFHRLLRQALA